MKRLALVVPALTAGGGVPAVARFLAESARACGRYEPELISLCMSSNDPCSSSLLHPRTWRAGATFASGTWNGFSYRHVGAAFGELEFQRYASRTILNEMLQPCDLVQVVSGSAAWACAVLDAGKPVSLHVATRVSVERKVRDAHARRPVDLWRKSMTRIADRMDDRALRRADAIQVMNPWMLDYVGSRNADRGIDIRYAPPGVDAAFFRPLPQRALGQESVILCVGRLDDPRKNVRMLLHAFYQMLSSTLQRPRLVLAGSAPPPDAFWAEAESLGCRDRITCISRPSSEALRTLYQTASMFALASDEEGFGVVLIEAMACGIPVVSTRSGGPDGIITDGSDGFLVPVGDSAAFAERLGRLARDQRLNESMGRQARATVESRFSDDEAGRVFVEIWDRLTASGKSAAGAAVYASNVSTTP